MTGLGRVMLIRRDETYNLALAFITAWMLATLQDAH
jgi:hypothetical protein